MEGTDLSRDGRWQYRLIPELTTWLNRKHGEVGLYLAQALSGHGCFNAYLRRFNKKEEDTCCYNNFSVDNAEHAFFICAKRGIAKKTVGRAMGSGLTPDTMVFLMHWSKSKPNGRAAVKVGSGQTDEERVVRDYKPEPDFAIFPPHQKKTPNTVVQFYFYIRFFNEAYNRNNNFTIKQLFHPNLSFLKIFWRFFLQCGISDFFSSNLELKFDFFS